MMKFWAVLTVAVLAFACSTGSSSKSDNVSGPMNDPPADSEPGTVPNGPDVILPEDERPATIAVSETETPDNPSVTRAEVDAFMEKGPPHILTLVTVEPSRDDSGKFVGYEIVDVTRSAREFMMPQLQVGDVVTHVNGVRQSKPEGLVNAWKALRRVDAVRVDFVRGTDKKTAMWSIR